jgi:hypothetical protein
VGFVVDKVGLGQVFSEYFGFSCQSLLHHSLHNHHHLSFGACTWPQYQVDSSLTPLIRIIIVTIIIIYITEKRTKPTMHIFECWNGTTKKIILLIFQIETHLAAESATHSQREEHRKPWLLPPKSEFIVSGCLFSLSQPVRHKYN